MKEVKKNAYKYCIVPLCQSTTVKNPNKVFFRVPNNITIRKNWCKLMKRDLIGPKSTKYVCEDHFDVENDTENLIKHRLVGGTLKLKPNICPHKFDCQKALKPQREGEVYEKRRRIECYENLSREEVATTSRQSFQSFEMIECEKMELNETEDLLPENMASTESENRPNKKENKGVQGEEDDELIGTEEWWNEHDSIIDEPELVLSNVEEDDKSNIKLHTEDHDNIPSSSQIENAQMVVDTEENSNQQQRRYSRKRLRTSRVTEDNTIDQENSTHPNTELKDQQNTKSICGAFGSYVSAKLESYSEYTRIMVEHKINEILFQADFGTFNEPTPNQQN